MQTGQFSDATVYYVMNKFSCCIENLLQEVENILWYNSLELAVLTNMYVVGFSVGMEVEAWV